MRERQIGERCQEGREEAADVAEDENNVAPPIQVGELDRCVRECVCARTFARGIRASCRVCLSVEISVVLYVYVRVHVRVCILVRVPVCQCLNPVIHLCTQTSEFADKSQKHVRKNAFRFH